MSVRGAVLVAISGPLGLRFAQRCAANLCPSARPGVARARATDARGITRSGRCEAPKIGDTRPAAVYDRVPLRARGAEPLRVECAFGRLTTDGLARFRQ